MKKPDLRTCAGLAFRFSGLLIIGLLVLRGPSPAAAIESLSRASMPLVFLACLTMLLGTMLRAWRWKQIADACGLGWGSFLEHVKVYYTGAFASTVLPSPLAALVPAAFVARSGGSARTAAVTVFLDRLVEIAVMAGALTAAGAYLLHWSGELRLAALVVPISVAVPAAALILLTPLRTRLRGVAAWRLGPALASLYAAAASGEGRLRRLGGRLAIASLLILALQIGVAFILAASLDLNVAALHLAAAYTLVIVATTVPISPLGLGPREGLLVALLSPAGVPAADALALGLLIFLVAFIVRLPGVLVWLSAGPRPVRAPIEAGARR